MQRLRDGDALVGERLAGADEYRADQRRASLAVRRRTSHRRRRLGLTEALRQVFAADADHLPAIVWGEHALRRYQDRLFLTPAELPALDAPLEWTVAPGSMLAARARPRDGCGGFRRSAAWTPGGCRRR